MAGVTNKATLMMKQIGKPFNGDGLLAPLLDTSGKKLGVEFPLTPTIQMSHSANYGTYDVTGSIYQQNYYINTPNPPMSITALFPANTVDEALYSVAALHFFKSCTKSDFGSQAGATAGTPPPILKFTCYGSIHASNVPCVIRSFTYTLPEDTDYVEVEIDGEVQSVPTLSLLSLELVPQLTPKSVKNNFNIRGFASGELMKGGNNGGFI
tara:strand:+ start:239 stop:868 length:630 start_codon:yes stop_codon:yes gene_type:complete